VTAQVHVVGQPPREHSQRRPLSTPGPERAGRTCQGGPPHGGIVVGTRRLADDHRLAPLVGRDQPRSVVAGNVAGDATGVGVPVPVHAVRVPLIQASHPTTLPVATSERPRRGPQEHPLSETWPKHVVVAPVAVPQTITTDYERAALISAGNRGSASCNPRVSSALTHARASCSSGARVEG
jgi:hypothetical protein